MNLLARLIINMLVIVLVAYLVPGIHISNLLALVLVVIVLGIINITLKPVFIILTLPINILTLGLFTLVINALMLWLAGAIVPGFVVAGFWPAFWGALVLSILHFFISRLEKHPLNV